MLNFTKQNLPFELPEKFVEFLTEHIKKDGFNCINLRSSNYDAESGGVRPVEIAVEKKGDDAKIHYYTEFAYAGIGIYAELVKSNDFDFINRRYASEFTELSGFGDDFKEVFDMFANNLTFYIDIDSFDEIKVTTFE